MTTYLIQILAGLSTGAVLFLVASGLTLTFGALRLANFAHGSLYMLGAFLMIPIAHAVGHSSVSFWFSMLLAACAVTVIGVAMEVVTFRPIYARHSLTQLIVTFGIVILIGGIVHAIWGSSGIGSQPPPVLAGGIRILGRGYPTYSLFLIALAVLVALVLWGVMYRTSLGRTVRAAVGDPELLEYSGVNVSRVFTGVFALGAFFAGLAGAAVSAQGAAYLGMDVDVVVKAFVVVVIGGMGSLLGAFIASILVGVSEALGVQWIPNSGLIVDYALLVLVLAIRQQGLFGKPERMDAVRRISTVRRASRRLTRIRVAALRSLGITSKARREDPRIIWILATVGLLLMALLPFVVNQSFVLVGCLALIYGLFALSLNLLVGTTGLVNFGHALSFGTGAYTVAIIITRLNWPPMLALAVTPLVGLGVAGIAGVIALRASEIYFSLLTLGLAQVAFAIALANQSFFGSDQGIVGTFAPTWLSAVNHLYWFILGCVLFCAALLFTVTRSPFGAALRGIRENRRRAEFIGLWLKQYELVAFAIAGSFGAIAGGLFAVESLQAYSQLFYWNISALPMISALLGGIGTFLGPLVGAFFYEFLNNYFSDRTVYWDIVVGTVIVVVALAMPGGLVGGIRALVGTLAHPFRDRRAEGQYASPAAGETEFSYTEGAEG